DWNDLWTILTVITVRKCGHRLKRFTAARRDINRERPATADSSGAPDSGVAAPTPTPLEAAMLQETTRQLFDSTKPRDHPVLLLRMNGCSVAEIADKVGCSERSVFRVLGKARDILTALEQGPDRPQ